MRKRAVEGTPDRIANTEAKVLDGQALDLPDGSFDAVFSMFGVTLFATGGPDFVRWPV